MWGNNIPVGWAFGIINFVWWIGIGHAGTFISAILLLLEQSWRTSINRFAEAMTLFAVIQAGLFPAAPPRPARGSSTGSSPTPSTMGVWPQFRERAAVGRAPRSPPTSPSRCCSGTWASSPISPRCATTRRPGARRIVYGIFALGWRGSARHYRHYRLLYGLLAGLATPLVLSVHSIVSSDFATAIVPGLALDDLPAVLRRGRDLLGLRDGAHAARPRAARLRPRQRGHRRATSTTSAR